MSRIGLVIALALSASAWPLTANSLQQDASDMRTRADRLFADQNFQEALTLYRQLTLDPENDSDELPEDFAQAVNCLNHLSLIHEFDDLLEDAVRTHPQHWRLLTRAAGILHSGEIGHWGFLVAGEFHRGAHRGGGTWVDVTDRDRVRALQLYEQARPLMQADASATPGERADVFQGLADAVGSVRFSAAWRLQQLTDLSELPRIEPGERPGWGFPRQDQGAPVDADGNPIFHQLPESWDAADSDGERWRWALEQVVAAENSRSSKIDLDWADFLLSQFGVSSREVGGVPLRRIGDDDTSQTPPRWQPHELDDQETIARLATGVRRLTLPEEFNHIRIYQRVAEREDGQQRRALEALVNVRRNRHQYPQAADRLRAILPLTTAGEDRVRVQRQIDQIEDNWISFHSSATQPAGTGARLDIRYRNGHRATFTARRIRIERLLSDVQDHVRSSDGALDHETLQIERIGHRLVKDNPERFLGEEVATWEVELTPPDNHFDALQTVSTPLQNGGAWWVTAAIEDGNETRIVLWVADMALSRKHVESGTLYFAADAVTGAGLPGVDLEFFGWRRQRIERTRRYQVLTERFADRTGADGLCTPRADRLKSNFQWLTIARADDGRLAYSGFSGIWLPHEISPFSYSPIKVFSITDRPVYRPEHTVRYRLWVRQPRFDDDTARFADQEFLIEVRNPKGDIVAERTLRSDRWGGLDGEYVVPADATLGRFQLRVCAPQSDRADRRHVYGTGEFRVEEYRKPEFEVAVEAPEKPVQLGEPFDVTVRADYYFGAPVAEGTVHYKVERTKKEHRWYPAARWDWLYGPGYWWFAPDYPWYPGWQRWGCVAPIPPWWGWQPDPPEVVAEGDAPLRPDGTLAVSIDTAAALANHGDSDHEYKITAEVVDQSRRTIIGTGRVVVAREPYQVFVWTDHGHYQTGDDATIGVQARTADGRGVSAEGTLTLLKVTWDGETPVETPVETQEIATDDSGSATLRLALPEAGQFRAAVELTDADGNTQQGGAVFFVRGPDEDGRSYRFNDLELVTDKREYAPGETVRLQVSTDRVGSTVLLFVRPADGVCPAPVVLRPEGKSTVYELPLTRSDMPNLFVEALSIADGRIHTTVREIVVPPEQRVANVEVLPSAERYRPGDEAEVTLQLTDLEGAPFVGNTVLSVYDASLEYIAESSIPDIRRFFWQVRRHHNPRTVSSLDRRTHAVAKPGEVGMEPLAGADPGMGGAGVVLAGGYGFGGGAMRASRRGMGVMDEAPAAPAEGMALAAPAAADFSAEAKSAGADVQPDVRTRFADTAHWVASVTSDASGRVTVRFPVPDNLTTWKVKAWTLGDGTRVGSGDSEIICSKDLIIRPQTPRFFTESDRITVSAVVHNYLDSAKSARVILESEGGQLHLPANAEQVVEIPAGGEVRVDWNVQVVASGPTTIRMSALTDEESDAAEYTVPVQVHGLLKTDSFTGVIRPDEDSATVTVQVPAKRIEEQSRLEIHYSPTLAGALVDALPYLLQYPYGCTEQTLNRFLPAVLTRKTLERMGIDLAEVRRKRTNLNAQELGDPADRAAQWQQHTSHNPVFDDEEMDRIIDDGVQALSDMQLADGGWGWFSGYGERSSAHLTAQVVRGLTIAREHDVPVLPDVIERGVTWLRQYQERALKELREGDWRREHPDQRQDRHRPWKDHADNIDAFVARVLTAHDAVDPALADYLYRDRGHLSVYSKALTGLVLHHLQRNDERDMVLRNIEQFLVRDDANQTAWLRIDEGLWWYWYGSDNEAMATYLELLLAARPQDETAPRLVKYLLNNRRNGTAWDSTRDTAAVVTALAEYIVVSGEDSPDMTVDVLVDGRLQKRVRIDADNLFSFDNTVLLQGDAVTTGDHQIEIRRTGTGPVYFNAYLTNFTREDRITATGLEVMVERNYYRLERDDADVAVRGDRGQVVSQQTSGYKRIPLPHLGSVTSGDLVEVELVIESRNDYEYLLLEDRKPSGFEPDDQRSGYVFEGMRAYRELRDDRVSLFFTDIARGRHSLTYRLRAETPSEHVSALPAKLEGMYAPELVGNSNEQHLSVTDR